jgi:AraC family transcriptional regulator
MLDTVPRHTALGARARSEVDRHAAVDRVIAAMHERIDRPFALEEMARIAYLSPFYFNRVFRQVTGVPPRRFHTALRIAEAKRLLLTTRLSVTEICLEIGYQSLGTFTTHFRELVSVSPRELRRLGSDPWLSTVEMADLLGSPDADSATCTVEGIVAAPDGHEDRIVFIGLFPYPYPQGLPSACTARVGSGSFALPAAAEGRVHLAAAAFPPTESVASCLLPDPASVLVASGTSPVGAAPFRQARRDLRLRPLHSTDPPLLLALPLAAAAGIVRPAERADAVRV